MTSTESSTNSSKNLLPAPSHTRLVTIIAHVDHGKTTLADNLLCANNIISENLAGTIRFLDSSRDEQRRGITMKGKAIALKHKPKTKNKKKSLEENDAYVIHLIDSPGHVDFSVEVTTSLLACDGALLVIDVVEGMCARTHAVMREAYVNGLVPILVINKIDKLCVDLGLSSNEAYIRIRNLIESVNGASAAMVLRADNENGDDMKNLEYEQEIWNFDPVKGNVLFVSAYYGWGFSIPSLAKALFQSKYVPIKPMVMKQYLFGDFRYHSETNKITKCSSANVSASNSCMFVEYGLSPIWDIYEGVAEATGCMASSDKSNRTVTLQTAGIEKVLQSLSIGFSAFTSSMNKDDVSKILNDIIMHSGGNISSASKEESLLRSILRRFRPLSDITLDAVCDHCPAPNDAQKNRKALLLKPLPPSLKDKPEYSKPFQLLQNAVRECDNSSNAPTIAQVSKFIATNSLSIRDAELTNMFENDDVKKCNKIMGLARVLSGTLVSNESYYLFGPRYSPLHDSKPPKHSIKLYIVMGSSFVRVNSVPAGHICAIYNLEDFQYKTITISDIETGCMPVRGFDGGLTRSRPLIKVHIEPVKVSDVDALEEGLLKLSLADSSVEVTATSKGERLLACLGELHMEQTVLDLKNMYCSTPDLEFRISDPIVDFSETTTWFPNETSIDFATFFDESSKSPPLRQVALPPYCDEEGISYAKYGRCRTMLGIRGAAISTRVVPLTSLVYQCLKEKKVCEESESHLIQLGKALNFVHMNDNSKTSEKELISAENILSQLLDAIISVDDNGKNAMIETGAMSLGLSVKGLLTKDEVVYVPSTNDCHYEQVAAENNLKNTPSTAELAHQDMKDVIRNSGKTNGSISSNIADSVDKAAFHIWKSELRGSAVGGFKMAMSAGPLCEEPISGVLVVLEGLEIAMKKIPTKKENRVDGIDDKDTSQETDVYATTKRISGGMVVSALRSAIRCSFLTRPVRIMEQHLLLTLHSSVAGLGPLYAVLSKRRGRVVKDSVVDGTDLLLIEATLPQADSFRLTPDLLDKSSGEVTAPELVFSHWEVLDEDPFWVPTTLLEREDYGEIVATRDSAFSSTGVANNALRFIRMVRKGKGLQVDSSKIVIAAEKQRTLARKK